MKGNDEILAVLLPGIDGTGQMFGPLIEQLEQQSMPFSIKVISYPTQEVLSYAELTEHVVKQISTEQPFIIIAESFSGPLALMVSQRVNQNLKALLLCCSFVTNPRPWLSKLAGLVLHDRLLSIPPTRFSAKLFVTGFDISDEMLDKAFSLHKMVAPKVFRHRLYEVFKVDQRDTLRDSKIPILLLYAKHDRVVLKYSRKQMQTIRPDLPCIVIDGPHYLLQLRPKQCVQALLTFLETI